MKQESCSALLLRLLVILLAVECSNANVHQASTAAKGKHLSSNKAEKDESVHTDVFEGTIATAYATYGRKVLGGRKYLSGMDEKPMHNSPGKTKTGTPEKPHLEPQNKEINHIDIDAKVEKDKLEAAAEEVANLMSKDYRGGGHGRRKPPINNQEPKD